MIEFIRTHIQFIIIVTVVLLLLGFAPTVTELPFGVDPYLVIFLGVLGTLANTIDFLQVPVMLLLASFGIEIGFFIWKWTRFFIGLYK